MRFLTRSQSSATTKISQARGTLSSDLPVDDRASYVMLTQ